MPGFPIYESQILANGAVPVPIYLRESRDFAFDPAELEAKITPQTRLLILNTPHNPTGGMLQPADLDAIAEILARHPQVWVFADEIYSRLAYAGAFDTLAKRPGMLERTIICDGASKTWAMTGGGSATRRTARSRRCSRGGSPTPTPARRRSRSGPPSRRSPGRRMPPTAMRASFRERRDLIVGLLNEVPGFPARCPAARSTRGPTSRRRAGSPAVRIPRPSASACCTTRASRCSPTSTSAGACPGTASTSASATPRRRTRSARACAASTPSCAGTEVTAHRRPTRAGEP